MIFPDIDSCQSFQRVGFLENIKAKRINVACTPEDVRKSSIEILLLAKDILFNPLSPAMEAGLMKAKYSTHDFEKIANKNEKLVQSPR